MRSTPVCGLRTEFAADELGLQSTNRFYDQHMKIAVNKDLRSQIGTVDYQSFGVRGSKHLAAVSLGRKLRRVIFLDFCFDNSVNHTIKYIFLI